MAAIDAVRAVHRPAASGARGSVERDSSMTPPTASTAATADASARAERDLVHAVRRGDNQAFDELAGRHMRRAFAVAYRILGQRQDAEDVVQDSFLTALLKLDTFDSDRPFGPWLLRLVANRAINARKARTLRQTEPIPDGAPSAGDSPFEATRRSEMRGELQRALSRQTYHILHFIGHGGADGREGHLMFEDKDERGYDVDGSTLGTLLQNHPSLRIAVLNACEGARTVGADAFAGVAQRLVQQGVPCVVAMQFEISDASAIQFSSAFYTAVASGQPVDLAVHRVRQPHRLAAAQDLLVAHGLARCPHGRDGEPCGRQHVDHGLGGPGRRPLLDRRIDEVVIGDALLHRCEALVREQLLSSHLAEQPRDLVVVGRADRHMPVGGAEDAERGQPDRAVARPRGDSEPLQELERLRRDERRDRAEHRDVDELPLTRDVADAKRREDPDHPEQR